MNAYNSERHHIQQPLSIETPKPVYHVNPNNEYPNEEVYDPASSHKSVRFIQEEDQPLSHSLSYSLSDGTTFQSPSPYLKKRYKPRLNIEDLESDRKNKFPYKRKSKKIK